MINGRKLGKTLFFASLAVPVFLCGRLLQAKEPRRHPIDLGLLPSREILCTRRTFSETADIHGNATACPALESATRPFAARPLPQGINDFEGAGAISKRESAKPVESDRQQLHEIQISLERALEQNRFDLLAPHLDEGFNGVLLYQKFGSREDFKALWAKIFRDIGKKFLQGFRVRVVPGSLQVAGNRAAANGHTEEAILTPFGTISFRANWEAQLEKKGGQWKLVSMHCNLDASHAISCALASLVQKIWLGGRLPDAEIIETLRAAS